MSQVTNPNPPAKRELVERALSDGLTDPAKIAAWARGRGVDMTAEEAAALKADIEKSQKK
jgi:hypothetical protein